MLTAVVLVFIVGYLLIAFEHPLKLDKTVPALLMGAITWALIALGHLDVLDHSGQVVSHKAGHETYLEGVVEVLLHHIGKIAEILIFLIGAMVIVELVDLHRGFSVITNRITTTNKRKMIIIISVIAFFLSAVLDNLTTTIVMISLVRRLVNDRNERLWFASMIVIAANAGGAWSPIGDVTTTMLWIGKKVSTQHLIVNVFLSSVICLAIPLLVVMFRKEFKGNLTPPDTQEDDGHRQQLLSSKVMLATGLGALIFVPIFKSVTHLPPYVGMMLGLGITWLVSEYIHPEEDFSEERRAKYTARHALSRIEFSSILFFLGILLTIAALESMAVFSNSGTQIGFLNQTAINLQIAIPNQEIVIILIGLLSAVIDNVPLVAATMGMYTNPMDAELWHFIAFAAGTGGSILIIGSAAGVAAMGLERIDFLWYLRKIAWIAFLGYIAGCIVLIAWFHFLYG